MVAAAGYPIVLVVGQIGSEIPSLVDPSEEKVLREAGTGSAGDRGAEGVDQRDGSNLTRVVGYLCLRRTKSCSLHHTAEPSLVAKGGCLSRVINT